MTVSTHAGSCLCVLTSADWSLWRTACDAAAAAVAKAKMQIQSSRCFISNGRASYSMSAPFPHAFIRALFSLSLSIESSLDQQSFPSVSRILRIGEAVALMKDKGTASCQTELLLWSEPLRNRFPSSGNCSSNTLENPDTWDPAIDPQFLHPDQLLPDFGPLNKKVCSAIASQSVTHLCNRFTFYSDRKSDGVN